MNKFKKILIGMVIITLAFVIGFVGVLIWLQSKSEDATKAKDKTEPKKTVAYVMENAIVTNVKDNMKVNIRVVPEIRLKDDTKEDKKFVEEFKTNIGLASTVIITLLRNKTQAELMEQNATFTIGEEITKELNKAYKTDKFVATYFSEFIPQ